MSVVTVTVLDAGDGGGWGGHVCACTSVCVCALQGMHSVHAGTCVHARVRSRVGSLRSKPTPPQGPPDAGITSHLWARLLAEQRSRRPGAGLAPPVTSVPPRPARAPLLRKPSWTAGGRAQGAQAVLSFCQLHGYLENEPLTLQLFIGTADDRLLRPHAFYQVHRITGKTVSTTSHEAILSNTKVLEIPLLPENNMRAM